MTEAGELKELAISRSAGYENAMRLDEATQVREASVEYSASLEAEKERLSREIDSALNNSLNIWDSVMIRNHTPKLLLDAGLKDYPILMSQKHIKNCLHEKGQSARWHGLSKEYLINIGSYLEHPAMVYDSLTGDDSIVVVTGEVDDDKLPIIVSIKMNGEGQYESKVISSNYLTSTYGHEHFANVLGRAIAGDDVLYVNREKTQSLEAFSELRLLGRFSKDFEFDRIIHKSNNIVNDTEADNDVAWRESRATIQPSARERVAAIDETGKEKKEMAEKEKNGEKLYISLNKAFCRQMEDKFVEGKTFNIMTMPKGTTLNGKDIGGRTISPLYMSESQFNKNEMTATYYLKEGEPTEIKLTSKDGSYEKVDVKELKEAVDNQQKLYREQQAEKNREKEQTRSQVNDKAKDREGELE